jgi:hypothetical protein
MSTSAILTADKSLHNFSEEELQMKETGSYKITNK